MASRRRRLGVTYRATGRETRCRASALGTDHASSGAGDGGECSDGPSCRGTPGAGEGAPASPGPIDKPPTVRAPNEPTQGTPAVSDPAALKAAFLAEVQKAKKFFYGTVIAQAHHIDVQPDRIVIAFAPQHKAMRVQVDPVRPTLEDIASRLAGRRVAVVAAEIASADQPAEGKPGEPRQSGPAIGAAAAGARRQERSGAARCVRDGDQGSGRKIRR